MKWITRALSRTSLPGPAGQDQPPGVTMPYSWIFR